ncbi:MAG: hypothetical protein HKO53_14060, partial [Gemmatimonadetes bacterium]|nr:hypothetical protein [Gemmatimonadota bacterium]
TIATRACRRMERLRAGQPSHMETWEGRPERGEVLPSTEPGPLELAEREEVVEWVRHTVAGLPEHHRLPLLLKDLEGLSISEVAAILDLQEATVKTRLHRGRMALASALTGQPVAESHTPEGAGAQACLDLLQARMDAGNRGVPFPIPKVVVCDHCRRTLEALHRVSDACAAMSADSMTPSESQALLQSIRGLLSTRND